MWEVRVALGPDLVSGRSRVRSLTVHGDCAVAETAGLGWSLTPQRLRSRGRARPEITVTDLLQDWLSADHGWRPPTLVGYQSAAGFLIKDGIGHRRAIDINPTVLRAACTAWRASGWPDPTVWARVRVLRSAVNWAYPERILNRQPLDGMTGPTRAGVRLHAPVDHVRAILHVAQHQVTVAAAVNDGSAAGRARLHRAEQVLLLTRLAADSGARRGELAPLQLTDLDGDVLTIARATAAPRGARDDLRKWRRGPKLRLNLGPACRQRRRGSRPAMVRSATMRSEPTDRRGPNGTCRPAPRPRQVGGGW